jgi:hypothetical protein
LTCNCDWFLEVPESGDDVEAVVDGVASAAALPQYLPVFEPGDDVFEAGPDPAVHPVMVVVDGPASLDQVSHCMAGHDDVVAVAGPSMG